VEYILRQRFLAMQLEEGDNLVNRSTVPEAIGQCLAREREAADTPDLLEGGIAHQPVERGHVWLHKQYLEVGLDDERSRRGLLAGAEIAVQHFRAQLGQHER